MNIAYLLKEIFAEKLRVILTMIAIGWGTLAIVLMLAVGQGMLETLTGYMQQLGSQLFVVSGGQTSQVYLGRSQGIKVDLGVSDMNMLRSLKSVQSVYPEYSANVPASHLAKHVATQTVSGVGGGYQSVRNIELLPGSRFINQLDVAQKKQVVVLGFEAAKKLFKANVNPVGQTIELGKFAFRVIGVTTDARQLFSYQTADRYLMWIPDTVLEKLAKVNGIAHLLVTYHQGVDRKALKEKIRDLLAYRHHVSAQDKTFVEIFDNQQMVQQTENFFMGVKFFLAVVGAITLLVAGLGIANIMYVAVQRATSEIGIRMACGAKPWDIVKQYMLEALLVTILGGALGFLISGAVMLIANPFLKKIHLFILKGFHLTLSPGLFVVILLILGCIGVLAGIFPAMRAAKILPVEALRSE